MYTESMLNYSLFNNLVSQDVWSKYAFNVLPHYKQACHVSPKLSSPSFSVIYPWLSRSKSKRLKVKHVGLKGTMVPHYNSQNTALKKDQEVKKWRPWRWCSQESHKPNISKTIFHLCLSLLPSSLLRPKSATAYTSPNLPVYFQFGNLPPFQPAKSRLSHSLVIHSLSKCAFNILGYVRSTNLWEDGLLKNILGPWGYLHFDYHPKGLLASLLTTVIHPLWKAIIIFLLKKKKKALDFLKFSEFHAYANVHAFVIPLWLNSPYTLASFLQFIRKIYDYNSWVTASKTLGIS